MIGLLVLLLALAYPHGGAASETPLQQAQALLAADQDQNQGFAYQATYMRYYEVGDSLLLQGDARVLHKGAQLEAAEIVFRRALDQVEARAARDSSGRVVGSPVLRQGEQTLRGERILYDLATEQGTILSGKIHHDEKYYAGHLIQTRNSSEFHIHEGSYTTCNADHPHFDFYSPRIKVLAGDIAVARPVYLRIKERRVFWIPFYIFSLREDRQSGLLTPSFGRDDSEWELRNLGYYIAPNDYWDLHLATDLRQRSGWLGRVRLNYAARYRFRGNISTQFENRQSGRTASRNWRLQFSHSQELGRDASLRTSGTFQSNTTFAQDNSTDLQDRLNRTLRSNLSYSRRWRGSGNSLSLRLSQTKYLDTEKFSNILPELSVRKSRKPIWGQIPKGANRRNLPWYTRIYYDGNARLRNTQSGSPTDTTSETSAQISWRINTQYRPVSWFNFSPSLSQDWRDQDLRDAETRGVRRDRFTTRASLSQTLYGLFHTSIGPLQAVRHVLKPNISFNYQATRADTGGVLGFGGDTGELDYQQTLNLRFDNTFWAKIQRDETERKVRLAQLNFSTAYRFREEGNRLDDLRTTLNFQVGRSINSRLTLRHSFYDWQDRLQLLWPRREHLELRTSTSWSRGSRQRSDSDRSRRSSRYDSYSSRSYDSSSRYGSSYDSSSRYGSRYDSYSSRDSYGYESGLMRDINNRWRGKRLQLTHYISRRRNAATRSWVQAALSFSWRSSWFFNYSLNYNLRSPSRPLLSTERITSELFSLQKEFHDWTATFNMRPSTFHETRAFFFKIQLKDIPQLKLERGQRRF